MAGEVSASSQNSSGGGPSTAQPSQSTSQGQGGTPEGGGGSVFDFKKAFESQGRELHKTKEGLGRMSQDLEGLKKDAETVRKMREVFNPESAAPPGKDPIEHLEQQLDYYLAEAVEAEKRGSPIPLTTNLAVQYLQSQMQYLKEKEEMQKVIKNLQAQAQRANDPQHAINNQAYSSLDTFVKQGLDTLYGRDETYHDQKRYQFDAVTSQIGEHLKLLQQHKPQIWEQMRRDPNTLKDLATHFLKKNLPPQAVKIIEQENLQNTEMATSELWQAFREAAAIKDPEQRRAVRTDIRQRILERMPWKNAQSGRS